MLMTEQTARTIYTAAIPDGFKMPRKGQKSICMHPVIWPDGIVMIWTDKKSPDGKRLFNCGMYRDDGTESGYFQQ